MYKVFITKKVEKELDRLDKSDAKNISQKILELDFPFPKNLDIKKMADPTESYRLRVGKVRAIIQLSDVEKRIYVIKVAYRGNIY